MNKIRVGIIGASSLISGMLLKLLASHTYVDITLLVSDSQKNKDISDIHRFLKGVFNIKTSSYHTEEIIENCDLVFLTKQHGEFLEKTASLIKKAREKHNIRFIDLSADFRLKDASLYEKWYNVKHIHRGLLEEAVYGISELYTSKIKHTFLIANPGCYPTCVILSVSPLFANKLVTKETVIIDAYCGVSGAGKIPNERNLAVEVEENIKPYRIGIHPHIPEMEQELSILANEKIDVFFAPHVASFKNGMFTTVYIKLNRKITWEEIIEKYEEFYKNKPFIRLCDRREYPEIQNIEGSNFCDIGVQLDERTNTCMIMSTIDNLIKGGSGQAVQNMNIMFGIDETEGLPYSNILKNRNQKYR